MYDWTPRLTTGVFGAALSQTQPGKARQFGYGVEAGYAVRENVWLNLGYTVRGLNDKDLMDNNYRNRGWFVGMRYKFDEKSFGTWVE
jgi:opacity protein-like surface antigen